MNTNSVSTQAPVRVAKPRNFETIAWMMMRYSAVLLIPLAFGHIILHDVLVGVHAIDTNYVAQRWDVLAYRLYTAGLLIFAFAHGMNGLRQVLNDYIKNERVFRVVSWVLLIGWLVISAIGAVALIGGVRAG